MTNKIITLTRSQLIEVILEQLETMDTATLAWISNELFPGTICEEIDNPEAVDEYLKKENLDYLDEELFDVIFPENDKYHFKNIFDNFFFLQYSQKPDLKKKKE